jgi:hypothetical protein
MSNVLVRIAVSVDADGRWCAVGDGSSSDEAKIAFLREHAPVKVCEVYFVEAEVPVPLPTGVIEGALVPYVAPEMVEV